jgi:hypothetical protein
MKIAVIALALCVGLAGCQYIKYPHGPDAGNLNHAAYAGDPGSVYDRAANPPTNIGRAAYDPNAPLPAHMPADETLPAGPPGNAVTTAPLNPAMANPAARPPGR